MARFNIDTFRTYAIAAVASLYCSVMLITMSGVNSAALGRLVI